MIAAISMLCGMYVGAGAYLEKCKANLRGVCPFKKIKKFWPPGGRVFHRFLGSALLAKFLLHVVQTNKQGGLNGVLIS